MSFDYSIHSDYLIHWTGKDIDEQATSPWWDSLYSRTNSPISDEYLKRLRDVLKFGLWMTAEPALHLSETVVIPSTPKCCFTELKLSLSRLHAKRYGRLGIGVKRPFLFARLGRPLAYYYNLNSDPFLQVCGAHFADPTFLNFFKPMNSGRDHSYDFYSESEWRIIYLDRLLERRLILDPRDSGNSRENEFFSSLNPTQQEKLKYLVPLDGWFQMIIYPSLDVKNRAQNEAPVKEAVRAIKSRESDHGNIVEKGNWPVEVDLDACRHF